MTVPIDSRVKVGVLTVDSVAFAAQASNVALVPNTKEAGPPLELLNGEKLTDDDETTWSLVFTGVQDFDDEDGWIEFARANANEVVTFSFKPNAGVLVYGGTCRVRPVNIGGPVAARNTSVATWPLVTGPTPDYTP